jgi:peptidoglycan/LPS O-acetylase OafA/YrhL
MHHTPPRPLTQRFSELDVLRLAAAVGVLLYHLTQQPISSDIGYKILAQASRFGFLGVCLFFMISGFVVLWSAGSKTPCEFVISRMTRLYPTFWVCVLLTYAAIQLTQKKGGVDLHTLGANLTMLAGFFHVPYVDGVYWTLTAELKFYGLLALLLMARQLPRVEIWVGVWICVSGIAVANSDLRLLQVLSIHPWGPFFASGCLYYLAWRDGFTTLRVILTGACAFLCIHNGVSVQHHFSGLDAPWARGIVVALLGGMQLLFLALTMTSARLPRSQVWYWLGAMTYPLYLLHNEFGGRIREALPAEIGEWSRLGLTIASVLAASAFLAYFVENKGCHALRALLQGAGRKQANTPATTATTAH